MTAATPACSSPTRYEPHPRSSSTNCRKSTTATLAPCAAISPEVRSLLAVVVVALVLPAGAAAHATLVRTEPANGAVLAQGPAAVRVVFDDTVRSGPGIAAIRNRGGSILSGKPRLV